MKRDPAKILAWVCAFIVLMLFGCGHTKKHVTEATRTEEVSSQTATNAVVTESSNVAEQKQIAKRTARKRVTSPDGWTVDLELVDEMLQVSRNASDEKASALASRTAGAAKVVDKKKEVDQERKPGRLWWHWLGLVPVVGILVVFYLLARHFRRKTGRWFP